MDIEKEWLTTTEVAKILRINRITLLRFEKRGSLVPTKYVMQGRRRDRAYSRKDILKFLGESEQS